MIKRIPIHAWYIAVGILSVVSYITTRDYIIATPINDIIVSNLTVSTVVLMLVMGGLSYWVFDKKLLKNYKNKATRTALSCGATGLIVMVAFMSIMGVK